MSENAQGDESFDESWAPEAKEPVARVKLEDVSTKESPRIDLMDEILSDAENVEAPKNTIEEISSLAIKLSKLGKEIDEDTVKLAEKQAMFDKIKRVELPEIMANLHMTEFKLSDGSVVAIQSKVNASISIDNKNDAHKWLKDNEFDGIIKTKVLSEFGKGEYEKAKKAEEVLTAAGIDAILDESVHAMTLKSFAAERLNVELEYDAERAAAELRGEDLPEDIMPRLPKKIFGVFTFVEANIKLPKSTKKK